jgi:single-stranded-DNA-specific exonuclease
VSGVRPLATAAAAGLDAPRRWVFRAGAVDAGAAAALVASLGVPPAVARLLVLRGHADEAAARQFMKPRLDALHDPLLLADIGPAVERLQRAIRTGELILVHGDYDVDGICAAALYTRTLRALGARVEPFVPHRMTDGYDLGHAGVRHAAALGATVILTGDCGVVAFEAIAEAAAMGIDVIVTDHHTPGAALPAAVAVINPNRPDCGYPEKGLAGAGVAFKLCEALVAAESGDRDALLWQLDLVALATIADLAPLRGENRILAHYGLKVLRDTRSAGLKALLESAGVRTDVPLTAGQVSHGLAPRLNAVGRMGAASRGVRLLLADSAAEAEPLAAEMEEENRSRQAVDRRILEEALALLEQQYDPARDYAVVLSAEGWHPGVIGIVASRVVERIHRPAVLIAADAATGRGRGSARSIRGYNLYHGIDACAGLLERYGGHAQAAGLELRLDRLTEFRASLNEHARTAIAPGDLVPEVNVDLEVTLAETGRELHAMLRHCGPFGLGNPQPVFVARGVAIEGYPREVGAGQHIRLVLSQDGTRLPAIGFRLAERLRGVDVARGRLDVAFHLHEDHWNGRSQLQARLVDLRAAQ